MYKEEGGRVRIRGKKEEVVWCWWIGGGGCVLDVLEDGIEFMYMLV